MNDTSGNAVRLAFDVTWGGPAVIHRARYVEGSFWSAGGAGFSGADIHAGASAAQYDLDVILIDHGQDAGTFGVPLFPTGKQQVVVLAAGDIRKLRYFLEGEGTLELVAQGPANVRTGHDLDGAAFADASVVPVVARTAVARTLDFTIDGYLFGSFLTPVGIGETYALATLTSANSTDHCGLNNVEGQPIYLRTKGCWFADFSEPAARGAGTYRLEWTGANAQYAHTPLIVWADIPAAVAPRP